MQSDITKARAFTKSNTKITGTVMLDDATGNEVALTLNYTTNKATSGNDTGLLINMTDPLSPGTSLFIEGKIGGSSTFKVYSSGGIVINASMTIGNDSAIMAPANQTIGLYVATNNAANTPISRVYGGLTGANVSQYGLIVSPTYTQTGTSAGTDLLINRTQTAVGSGAQLLIDAQVAGSSKFKVTNAGLVSINGVQVLGDRVIDARADDVANSGDATTDGLIDALRDAMIAHGLIAAA